MKTSGFKAQEIVMFAHEQAQFQTRVSQLSAHLSQLRLQHDRWLLYSTQAKLRLTPPLSALIVRVESYMQTQVQLFGGIIVHLTIDAIQEFQPGKLHWCEYKYPPRLGRKTRSATVVHPLVDRSYDIEHIEEQLSGLYALLRHKF